MPQSSDAASNELGQAMCGCGCELAAALASSGLEAAGEESGRPAPQAMSSAPENPIKKRLMSFMSACSPPRLATAPGKTTSADAPFSGSLW